MMRSGARGRIFVNYRRGDDPGSTTALYMQLVESFGPNRVFMDVEGHIRPGDDFAEVLEQQVSQCDVLLVVIGPKWESFLADRGNGNEDFVLIEIKAAIDQGKRIIPVLVGNASMPPAAALPELIRPIARRNAVFIRHERFKSDCQGLSESLRSILSEIKHVQPDIPKSEPRKTSAPIVSKADLSASSKIAWRLIPYLMLCYFVAYLDRVNLGFAALTFKSDLGFSDAAFGLGAGIFFVGYFIFEVPSNIILEKAGARKWIARIMVTWGLVSAATAFVKDETSFYVIRFVLGVAEAGFFPGIILYLTYWYTAAERARMVGLFMVAIALSGVIGAPVSTLILTNMSGVQDLKGWQWLFILEALPAVLLGIVTYFYLTDRPADASWLTDEEREEVSQRLLAEKASREAIRKFSVGEALRNPRVLGLALVYFGIVTGLYGLGFWLPQIVKAFGLSTSMTGWAVAVPYLFSAAIMIPWTRHSDRTGERVWHVVLAAFLGGGGIIVGAYLADPLLAMVALTLGSIGIFAALPTFWTLPTAILTGTAAAAGIALINAVGNLGGFAGPVLVGWIRNSYGDPALATAALGGFMIVSGLIALLLGHDKKMEGRF